MLSQIYNLKLLHLGLMIRIVSYVSLYLLGYYSPLYLSLRIFLSVNYRHLWINLDEQLQLMSLLPLSILYLRCYWCGASGFSLSSPSRTACSCIATIAASEFPLFSSTVVCFQCIDAAVGLLLLLLLCVVVEHFNYIVSCGGFTMIHVFQWPYSITISSQNVRNKLQYISSGNVYN